MAKYQAAYEEFNAKYGINFNLYNEYLGVNSLSGAEDFSVDATPERKAQNSYIETLATAMKIYLGRKTKIENGKSYDMSDVSLSNFIVDFDNLMNAILSDEAEKNGEE